MSRHHEGAGTSWQLRKLADRVKAERPDHTCARCGGPIDLTLHWQDQMAFTLGHVIPASQAPHLKLLRSNVRAEHRRCNREGGDRPTLVTASEQW